MEEEGVKPGDHILNHSPETRQTNTVLELLLESAKAITSEVDLEKLVQRITDIGTTLSGAEFGAFFYNVENESGEKYLLYTISGVPKEAFSKFPMPRNTSIFGPTFAGKGIVRYDDVTRVSHYGQNPPYHGMPKGHLLVRSYLAAPVISPIDGEVIGGLFFGHSETGVFTAMSEKLIEGVAAQAAIAMGNARLFEEKRKIKQLLEDKVKERTAELEKLNFELLQFTSVASHDLKEPLRKISIFSKMLRDKLGDTADASMQKYMHNIIYSAGRMSVLIDDLLAFSRLSQEELLFEQVDLDRLVKDIWEDLEISVNEKNATLHCSGLPVITGVPLLLGQVFQNLFSNSLKFAHADRIPVITLSAAKVEADQGDVYALTYADNGIGFRNEYAGKIFEVFQRLHTKDQYEGTGIGLAIVRKIIALHHGSIQAFGIEGEGCRFEMLLPARRPL